MSLVLQEINVQVKYWSHASLTKKEVKEVMFIKTQQQSRQKDFYRDLMLKLDKSSTQVVSVKNYEIRFFRSNYTYILKYLCRVSFLTALDIYKDYFKSRHKGCEGWKRITHAYCDRRHNLLWFIIFFIEAITSLRQGFCNQGASWSLSLMNWRTLQPTILLKLVC